MFNRELLALLGLVGCGFSSNAGPSGLPDGGVCLRPSTECFGDTLRSCAAAGDLAIDELCNWGCLQQPVAHCGELEPHGGGVSPDDVTGADVLNITLANGMIIDADTGRIGTMANPTAVRAPGEGITNGIEFRVRSSNPAIGVFRFSGLTIQGTLAVSGVNAVALLANGDIVVEGVIDVRGTCVGQAAGPGGFPGGAKDSTSPGAGPGGGAGTNTDREGGGAGGHGGAGGPGKGLASTGGPTYGDAEITKLQGGSGGGGGGGGNNAGAGAGGGGAIQLVSNGQIRIANAAAGINAGGCGGVTGEGSNDGGGGAGAGGTILLEAKTITIEGTLAVNGGGGGGGDADIVPVVPGESGRLDSTRAAGFPGPSAPGGDGAAGTVLVGGMGGVGPTDDGGGGGGGVGRIRINTRSGRPKLGDNANLSPSPDAPGSTCTFGDARVR